MNYNFNELSFDELKEIKTEVSAILKEKNAEHKEELKTEKITEREHLSKIGKSFAVIGEVVGCSYKGDKVLGTIIKINPKTVSVKLTDVDGNEIIGKNDKQVVTWKYFWQIHEIA